MQEAHFLAFRALNRVLVLTHFSHREAGLGSDLFCFALKKKKLKNDAMKSIVEKIQRKQQRSCQVHMQVTEIPV